MKKNKMKKCQHRPMLGYQDLYLVSIKGDVWSIRAQRYLALEDNTCGYLMFIVCNHGQRIPKLIHRAVVEAFVRRLGPDEQVNHLDRNPYNNCLDNLEICTAEQHGKYHRGKNNGHWGTHKSAEQIARRSATRKRNKELNSRN